MKPGWQHFEHVADIGVEGRGPTLGAAFEMAALAMTAVAVEPERVRCDEVIEVRCEASDVELLLVEWLDALIYEADVGRRVFAGFDVRISEPAEDGEPWRLSATARGEALDVERHEPAVEVKGATLYALEVARIDGGFAARCVVDV